MTGRDAIQHAVWRALVDAGHPVTTSAASAAADAVLEHLAARAELADLEQWAPAPRPQLMVDLHESVPWNAWDRPHVLARTLRAYADRLDETARRRLLDHLQEDTAA